MTPFAMTASFLSAPVFAWLNLGLLDTYQEKPRWLLPLAWLGLIYLVAMVVYLLWARSGQAQYFFVCFGFSAS